MNAGLGGLYRRALLAGVDELEQLIDGRLSTTLAYSLGRIKVEGSLGVAIKLAGLLEG
jgi:putative sterol carrier protein